MATCLYETISLQSHEQLVEYLQSYVLMPTSPLQDPLNLELFKKSRLNGPEFLLCTLEAFIAYGFPEVMALQFTNFIHMVNEDSRKRKRVTSMVSDEAAATGKRLRLAASHLLRENAGICEKLKTLPRSPESKFADPTSEHMVPFPFQGPVPNRFKVNEDLDFKFFGRSFFKSLYSSVTAMDVVTNRRLYLHGTLGSGKSHMIAALAATLRRESPKMLVCYIPDCYELLMAHPPAEYIIRALYSTFCEDEDEDIKDHLMSLLSGNHISPEDQENRLRSFCAQVAYLGKTILFIIDQANALDDADDDRVSNKKKEKVRTLLDGISHQHIKLESSTANYRAARHDTGRNIGERRLVFNGGLNDEEIKRWWKNMNSDLDWEPSEHDQKYFERLTGRMPILLNVLRESVTESVTSQPDNEKSTKSLPKATAPKSDKGSPGGSPPTKLRKQRKTPSSTAGSDGEKNSPSSTGKSNRSRKADTTPLLSTTPSVSGVSIKSDLSDICSRMMQSEEVQHLHHRIFRFGTSQLNRLEGKERELRKFQEAWQACILEMPVGRDNAQYLDTRYFYVDEDGIGRSTSDFARKAGAAFIEGGFNATEYSSKAWLNRIASFADNPTVLGFLLEKISIAHLVLYGAPLADRDTKGGTSSGGPTVATRSTTRSTTDGDTRFASRALKRITFDNTISVMNELSSAKGVASADRKTRSSTAATTHASEQSFICIPAAFNYPSVDCILVSVPKQTSTQIADSTAAVATTATAIAPAATTATSTSPGAIAATTTAPAATTATATTVPAATTATATTPAAVAPAATAVSPKTGGKAKGKGKGRKLADTVATASGAVSQSAIQGKTIIVGIQFTLSENHKPTEEPFMQRWRDWEGAIATDGDFEFRFIWVLEKLPKGENSDWVHVPAKLITTRSSETRMVHPEYYRRKITFDNLSPEIGKRLAKIRPGLN